MAVTDRAVAVPCPVPSRSALGCARSEASSVADTGAWVRWRTDLSYLLSLATLLLALTSLPYLWGYVSAPPDRQFMGLTFTTHDYAQYMSWARESERSVFVQNKLTSEPTEAIFFNPVWWLVGQAQRIVGLPFAAVNQGLRFVAGFAFVLVLGAFAALVVPGPERRFAVALACVASGFGWVLVLVKQVTGTLAAPLLVQAFPGNTFFGMMVVPHMVLSASMVIGVFVLMLDAYRHGCGRRALLAGLLCLALGFAHPYNIVTVYAVIGVFTVLVTFRDGLRLRWVAATAAFYAVSVPSVLYWLGVAAASESWREVLRQYRNLGVFTPDPLGLLVLLGATAIMAVLALRMVRPREVGDLFVITWLGVQIVIVYLPVEFQINLLNGIQVPLGILAARWIYRGLLPWLAARRVGLRVPTHGVVLALVLLLVIPTNAYLLAWRVVDLGRHTYPDYVARDDAAALAWLNRSALPSEVVLSSMAIGHYLPGLSGTHAFLASGVNTLDFYAKRAAVEQFFAADTSPDDRQSLLAQYGIGYVFHGPAERALGGFEPATADYLQPVFTTAHTVVYRVALPAVRR